MTTHTLPDFSRSLSLRLLLAGNVALRYMFTNFPSSNSLSGLPPVSRGALATHLLPSHVAPGRGDMSCLDSIPHGPVVHTLSPDLFWTQLSYCMSPAVAGPSGILGIWAAVPLGLRSQEAGLPLWPPWSRPLAPSTGLHPHPARGDSRTHSSARGMGNQKHDPKDQSYPALHTLFISWGCLAKSRKLGDLRTTEMNFLIALGVGSLNPRGQQGHAPSQSLQEDPPSPLQHPVALRPPWPVLASSYLCLHLPCVSPCAKSQTFSQRPAASQGSREHALKCPESPDHQVS